jgi:molybdopterin-biosynthesis enzyme MoeA-like protein
MAWPMVEWVLDTRYATLFNRDRWREAAFLVFEAGESELVPLMEAVEARFSKVKVFSLPAMGPQGKRLHIELGVRGHPDEVAPAVQALREGVRAAGFPLGET